MVSRSNPLSELARLGFEELSESLSKLDQLVELIGDSGNTALNPLANSASPDRALDALLRLVEIDSKRLEKLLNGPEQALRLCRLLGASDAMAEFLIRNPKQLDCFDTESKLPESFKLSSADRNQLRATYRSHLLRIVDFDLSSPDPLSAYESVSSALTKLTDAALSAAMELAGKELVSEGRLSADQIKACQLAVIAMGKTGAEELNYVSDVDVIYVVDAESIDSGTKLATRLAACLFEPDYEEGLWQVDANLRPEGKSGALVRTLEAHKTYYEKWAEPWEFQALLKARPAAGSIQLGNRYIDQIKPLIWSYPERSRIVESTRHLRKRVLENLTKDAAQRDIKLGRGGLRDVEFTAQLMQLVHGVTDETLRSPNTILALNALSESGLLARDDSRNLQKGYQLLRVVEHRIQLIKLRRTHLIPVDKSELRRVARGLNLNWTAQDLETRLDETRTSVAALHDSVFYRPLLAATAALEVGDVQLSDAAINTRLRAIGFRDPAGAMHHISALTSGVSRRATIQKTLLPVLIRWMAEGIDPDRALLSFRRLSESLGETHWFLKMLRDSSGAAERLMRVLSSSSFIARLLEHIPDSSAWFGEASSLNPMSKDKLLQEMQAIADREDTETAAELVRQIRRREVLRLAIGGVLGELSMVQISQGLTNLVDNYLTIMLRLATKEVGSELDFGIIAMGRWGGGELGFGSDADAMLVYQSESDESQQVAERIASQLMLLSKDSLLEFELDLGLRPEGKNGPRVRSLASYSAYYEKWADTWEFQALLRARMLTGSESLKESFYTLIDHYRYPEQLSEKQLTEIRRIKARVESERLPLGADPARHLKLGRGSISDIEWLVQLYQLRFAYQYPQLRSEGTLAVLTELERLSLITHDQSQTLRAGWSIATRARSALVLAVDKLVDLLPTDRVQLEATARILEYAPGAAAQLEDDYLSATRRARKVFEELF
jgi:glutamate-ammonia-ligase adenylyltransferase